MKSSRVRTLLSSIWLIFTLSLVTWWFIFALRNLNLEDITESSKHYKMLFYEGSTLLLSIFLGGIVLIGLSYRDDRRHQKLKMFFSNFTHEIKTSITRLRLQADILMEQDTLKNNKILQRLLTDVAKLDLQLENSLLLSHVSESTFLFEKINLTEIIGSIQNEFEDLKIQINGDATLHTDSRAFKSVIRNLLENSRRHGQATEVKIDVVAQDDRVQIVVQDNGSGNSRAGSVLGSEVLSTSANQGSGIGLFLSMQLISKMNGNISFDTDQKGQGFQAILYLKGQVL